MSPYHNTYYDEQYNHNHNINCVVTISYVEHKAYQNINIDVMIYISWTFTEHFFVFRVSL